MCENLYALDAIFVLAHKQYCFKSYYFKINSGQIIFLLDIQLFVILIQDSKFLMFLKEICLFIDLSVALRYNIVALLIISLYKIIDYINRKIIMQYCIFSR